MSRSGFCFCCFSNICCTFFRCCFFSVAIAHISSCLMLKITIRERWGFQSRKLAPSTQLHKIACEITHTHMVDNLEPTIKKLSVLWMLASDYCVLFCSINIFEFFQRIYVVLWKCQFETLNVNYLPSTPSKDDTLIVSESNISPHSKRMEGDVRFEVEGKKRRKKNCSSIEFELKETPMFVELS